MTTDIPASLSRLLAAHAEFDRVAAETLAMLADYQRRSEEREERMREVTREAIEACDVFLTNCKEK